MLLVEALSRGRGSVFKSCQAKKGAGIFQKDSSLTNVEYGLAEERTGRMLFATSVKVSW